MKLEGILRAASGTRTHDLFVTNEMLYRLSYCGLSLKGVSMLCYNTTAELSFCVCKVTIFFFIGNSRTLFLELFCLLRERERDVGLGEVELHHYRSSHIWLYSADVGGGTIIARR